MQPIDFSLVIFSSRENYNVLIKSIYCAVNVATNSKKNVLINVLINGNEKLYNEIQQGLAQLDIDKNFRLKLAVYFFEYGDKANAWNQYFYLVKPVASYHIFIDGYVYVLDGTFKLITDCYEKKGFMAASGVPSFGRSAKCLRDSMIKNGGIHGNLCILTEACIEELTKRKFNLPIKLYRVDGLIGAIINFDFSPKDNPWNSFGVRVIENLTWKIDTKNLFDIRILLSQLQRKQRQIRGDIENNALKELLAVLKIDIGALPDSCIELLYNYTLKNKPALYKKLTSPLQMRVYKQIKEDFESFRQPDVELLKKHKVFKI